MPTYLLDILVEDAQLYTACSTIRTPLWITIRADGLQQGFDTPSVPACPRPSWRTPVRLVLNLPSLNGCHFKATLRTSGYLGEVISIACSQVRLSGLPTGRPRSFQFALQNTRDFAEQAATLSVTAAISELALSPQAQPPGSGPPDAGPRQRPPATWRAYPGAIGRSYGGA
jgi:hypothetical protein